MYIMLNADSCALLDVVRSIRIVCVHTQTQCAVCTGVQSDVNNSFQHVLNYMVILGNGNAVASIIWIGLARIELDRIIQAKQRSNVETLFSRLCSALLLALTVSLISITVW